MVEDLKIGIIFCAYNVEKYVEKSIAPFLALKDKANLNVVSVSVPFLEYSDADDYEDSTIAILKRHKGLDALITEPKFVEESTARNMALQELFKIDDTLDYIWLVDGDELYTEEEILAIIEYIKERREVTWFKLCLKNILFDGRSYLKEPFTPPRIFKPLFNGFYCPQFYWDNDWSYVDGSSFSRIDYKKFGHETIPKEIAWITHATWLNDEIGQRKVAYQKKHFGHCSFKWIEEEQRLDFDEEYYIMTGEKKPEIEIFCDDDA